MPRNWSHLANDEEQKYTELDFKQAMYQLVFGQCLYARFPRHAVAYRLISSYRKEFAEALDLMGLELGFNDAYNYCYVRQDVSKLHPMELQETFFLLTLRKAYHQRASLGDLTEHGSVLLGIEEFDTLYKELARRDFDGRGGALKELCKTAKAHGLARETESPDEDPQPFAIEVMPGIADVISQHALDRFGADLKAATVKAKVGTLPQATEQLQ
jgi:hypothetical protein